MYFSYTVSFLSILAHVVSTTIEPTNSITPRTFIPPVTSLDPDCVWAGARVAATWLQCTSDISYGELPVQRYRQSSRKPPTLKYHIEMSGTGQNVTRWCEAIMEAIPTTCGPRAVKDVVCRVSGTLGEWVFDSESNNQIVLAPGLDLEFEMGYTFPSSFSGLDHDHGCMSTAIAVGTCPQVQIMNGAVCYSKGFVYPEDYDGDTSLDGENSQIQGPAIDQAATQSSP